jgi:hypothetical protein
MSRVVPGVYSYYGGLVTTKPEWSSGDFAYTFEGMTFYYVRSDVFPNRGRLMPAPECA